MQRLSPFPRGQSALHDRVRRLAWIATPLGDPATWSLSLRTAASLMLDTRQPMCMAWGPDLVLLYNDAYAPLLGARDDAALGRPLREVWSDVRESVSPLIDSALAGEATWSEDFHLVMPRNGYPEDTWWSFSFSPQRDDDGTVVGMLNVCTDATAKVLSEIRHAFWLALETDFWIFDDPSRIQTAAARALNRHLRVNRAATLTHRLLAFSRRQTLAPKVTDVKALVGGMEDLIVRIVGPSIAFEIRHDVDLWPSMVDPSQLENALLNLCINARDAMPDGGTLTVQTANCRMDGDAARSRSLEPGDNLALTVTDSGSGMTPDVVTKAFDPFFTTQPIGMGTGLGRSMVYGFAKQSHGMASIVAQPAQGAAVSLYLPRHVGTAKAIDVSVEPPSFSRATAGETVLVVDDEPTIRMLVADVLDSRGDSAIEAHDVASDLKVLHSNVRIDLLITDIGLPGGLNGREVADAARVSRPDLKVLFITDYTETAVLSHGHLDPGMHVLTKLFEMETLAARVKELIAASRNN